MKFLISFLFVIVLPAFSFSQSQPGLSEFGLSFLPDQTFKGSTLSGWHLLGDATWQASNGELTGKANAGSAGWLVLDKGYQDAGFHALFKTTGNSQTALVFRLEQTATGYNGVLLSLKKDDINPYSVTFDSKGKELTREKLRIAGGINYRMAPPPDTTVRRGGGGNFTRPVPPADVPMTAPSTEFRVNDWNEIEVFIETNVIRSFLNDGREIGGAVDGATAFSGYGPIAIYVAGEGEVHIKDVMYKDLSIRNTPLEKSSPRFRVQRISDMYYSWGADAADFNKDGSMDVVSGPYIYFGPDYTKHKEIFPAIAVGPSKEFTRTNVQFTYDFNGDGWPDVLTSPSAAVLFINPKGESRRWKSYDILPSVQSEITAFVDIDKDGKPELVYGAGGYVRYAKPDPSDPTKPWKEYNISASGYALAHGIGTGDINNDGRIDVLNPYGWWEQPATPDGGAAWKYHPVAFGRYKNRASNVGGSLMAVYDANGDGLNDVVTNLNVHGFGLAWFEQRRDASGNITFVQHMINDDYSRKSAGDVTFSQGHGSTFADIDKDGIPDYIVGKRYFTHLDNMYDPDSYGAPVLYWYRTVRNPKAPGGAQFVPELIHNRSGAGSEVTAVDLNKDGAIDIITATNHGTFIFWNKPVNKTK
jgi:hypothetical protein